MNALSNENLSPPRELIFVGEFHELKDETKKVLESLRLGPGDIVLLEGFPCFLSNDSLFDSEDFDSTEYEWLRGTGATVAGWSSDILAEEMLTIKPLLEEGMDLLDEMDNLSFQREKVLIRVVSAANSRNFSRIVFACQCCYKSCHYIAGSTLCHTRIASFVEIDLALATKKNISRTFEHDMTLIFYRKSA